MPAKSLMKKKIRRTLGHHSFIFSMTIWRPILVTLQLHNQWQVQRMAKNDLKKQEQLSVGIINCTVVLPWFLTRLTRHLAICWIKRLMPFRPPIHREISSSIECGFVPGAKTTKAGLPTKTDSRRQAHCYFVVATRMPANSSLSSWLAKRRPSDYI